MIKCIHVISNGSKKVFFDKNKFKSYAFIFLKKCKHFEERFLIKAEDSEKVLSQQNP